MLDTSDQATLSVTYNARETPASFI